MENEEMIGKYMVDGLILIEDYDSRYLRLTILAQKDRNYSFDGVVNGTNVRIMCDSSTEYSRFSNTLYLKGRSDFNRTETYALIGKDRVEAYEEALKQIGFIVVHSREEANMYLTKEEKVEEKLVEMKLDLTPTDEEIEKMISLVDLDVFTKIIQSRLINEVDDKSDLKEFNKTWAKEYLVRWAKAKYRFYKLFGEKLTLEKEVDYIKGDNDAHENKQSLMAEFPLYAPIIDDLNERCFREDKVRHGWISSKFRNTSAIKDDMTLTKFFALYGNKELDVAVSKLFQSKGKSKITISIDPNDYLTVSLNKSGWESCHLFFSGCYQNAGLSYLFDETSLVSYSSRNNIEYNEYYRSFTWNNKRWREMVYVSKENSAMVFSRQYPYFEEAFSKEVRAMLEEKISEYFGVENNWYTNECSEKYADVEHEYGLLYNDTKNGYDYRTVINKSDNKKEQVKIEIGSYVRKFSDGRYNLSDGDESLW